MSLMKLMLMANKKPTSAALDVTGRSQDSVQLEFQEQLKALELRLGKLVPTAQWTDMMHNAHDRAFTVAGAMKADLLTDLAASVDKRLKNHDGGLEGFRKDFDQIVAKHGWAYNGERDWRTRTIYKTNMLTSYASGRLAQLKNPQLIKIAPWWTYRHNDNVIHPRPHHYKWGQSQLTLPHDHPFWKTHYPPNGWGCHCYVTAKRKPPKGAATEPPGGWSESDSKTGAPPGIDRGWGYQPGLSVVEELGGFVSKKAQALPPTMAKDFKGDAGKTVDKLKFDSQKTAKAAGQWAVDNDLVDYADYSGVKPEVANAFNESLVRHLTEFPELRKNQQFIGSAQAQFTRWYNMKVAEKSAEYVKAGMSEEQAIRYAKRVVKKPRTPGNAWAQSWMQDGVRGVAVNKKWGGTPEALKYSLGKSVVSQFHPPGCDSIKSIIDHELGHQLDGLLALEKDPEVVALFREALDKGIKQEVSTYAGHNIKEFIAEAWSEYQNNSAPRLYARRIAGIIRTRYRSQFADN